MLEVPKYLYRGITLNYELLNSVTLDGVDIVPPYGYVTTDNNGRKIRSDGNEYGVYMTDKLDMAENKYGFPETNFGTLLANWKVGRFDNIRIPQVGVVYKINTDHLDTHRAFLSEAWSADRKYRGDEWISEIIPAQCYSIQSAVISADILHDRETIVIYEGMDLSSVIRDKVEKRKRNLELMIWDLKKVPEHRRINLNIELLRNMYGDGGARHILPSSITIDSNRDCIKYLMASIYRSNIEQIDFSSLEYVMSLKKRLSNLDDRDIDAIIQLIQTDLSNDKLHINTKNRYINILNILNNKKKELEIKNGMTLEDRKNDLKRRFDIEITDFYTVLDGDKLVNRQKTVDELKRELNNLIYNLKYSRYTKLASYSDTEIDELIEEIIKIYYQMILERETSEKSLFRDPKSNENYDELIDRMIGQVDLVQGTGKKR